MSNYFGTFYKVRGLNADIERHTKAESDLRQKIETLEMKLQENPHCKMTKSSLKAYREFLNVLLQSKAEVVSKIGRKNQ